MLPVVLEQLLVLQVGVELDLVDGGRDAGGLEEPGELLGQVVRDADRAREAGLFEGLHLRPFGLVRFFAVGEEGGVDEVAFFFGRGALAD